MTRRRLVRGGLVALALAAPYLLGSYRTFLVNLGLIYAAVALSLVMLTGWTGLPSLGHAAFFGIGAFSAVLASRWDAPFVVAFALALAVAIPLGLIVGLPALRVGGLLLAVATLGLGVAVQRTVFEWNWLTGGKAGLAVDAPNLFGIRIASDRRLYYLIVAVVGAMFWGVANLRRSRVGRGLSALRASEQAAAAAGIPIVRYKLLAFVVSGSIAAFAGCLYAYLFQSVGSGSFDAFSSFNFLAIAVIGGIHSIWGALVAGLFNSIGPQYTRIGDTNLDFYLISSLALIFVLVRLPDGLVSLPRVVRDGWRRFMRHTLAEARERTAMERNEPHPPMERSWASSSR